MGNTGECSDYRQWPVDAWLSEDRAKARVIELEHLLRINLISSSNLSKDHKQRAAGVKAVKSAPNGDPMLELDWYSAGYEIMECELKLEVATALPAPDVPQAR